MYPLETQCFPRVAGLDVKFGEQGGPQEFLRWGRFCAALSRDFFSRLMSASWDSHVRQDSA